MMRCAEEPQMAEQPRMHPGTGKSLFARPCLRTGQRRLAEDPEVPGLVSAYLRADADARREAASMDRLLELCRPAAEQIARGYLRSEEDVADVVQEGLFLLARRLPQLRETAAFPAWFAQVMNNAARQWLRRERAHREELSLDRPPRWDGRWGGSERLPLDVADRATLDDLSDVENRVTVRRYLQLVPDQQRAALSLAYLDGLSHERVGRELGVTARGVEGLAYRGLQRLQAIAAQCTDGPEPMGLACTKCRMPLEGVLLPGDGPDLPLLLRVRCAGCMPTGVWMNSSSVRYGHYALLDDAWERSGVECLRQALAWAERRRRGDGPHCWRCATPLTHDRHWWTPPWRAGGRAYYMLSWQCGTCRIPYSPMHVQLGNTAAARHPRWRAFVRSARYLDFGPERLVAEGGEDVLVVTAWDAETGRRGTLRVACEALAVRRVEIGPA